MKCGIPTVCASSILFSSLTIVDHKMTDTRVNHKLGGPRRAEQRKVMADLIHLRMGKNVRSKWLFLDSAGLCILTVIVPFRC